MEGTHMIETAHTARIQQAYARAHQERGEIFAKILGWIFGNRHVPLGQTVLTEPSRCA